MRQPFSRRSFLQLTGGVSMATLLSGCFGVGGASSISSSSDTTQIVIWDVRSGQKQQLVQKLTTNFNQANPHINATVNFFQNSSYQQKISVALGAHTPPDMFFSWGGGILKSFVDAGDIYDVTTAFQSYPAWKDRFFPSVMKAVTFNGKIYGIPNNGTQPNLMFYNKDIFARYHLQPPTTWNELLQLVQTLKQKGVQPVALGGKTKWPYEVWTSYLVDRLGGPEVFEAVLNNTAGAWSHPAVIQTMTMIQELVATGTFGSVNSFLSTDYPGDLTLLYTGKAAMVAQGSFAYSAILANAPDFIANNKLGWFAFPKVDGGKGDPSNVTGNPTTFYAIAKDSKHPDAALTYIKDVAATTTDVSGQLTLGSVIPIKGIESQLASAPHSDWLNFTYQLAANAQHFQLSWDQALTPNPTSAVLTNMDLLFAGQMTPKQFSDAMNKTIGT